MNIRTRFLIQFLQKLGAPLMAAVESRGETLNADEKASAVASLLAESVKVGISLSQAMNIKADDGNDDAIRAALAGLAATILSDTYRQTGRVPGENETRRISKILESVIVFADNFTPAAEHAARLETLEGPPPFFDALQTDIYALHALLPAVIAVSEFSFGQPDTRLIQDVADRLTARAKDMRARLAPLSTAMGEMVILQALGQCYEAAHRNETALAQKAGDGTAQPSMTQVWAFFDRQAHLLEILLGAVVRDSETSGAAAPAPVAASAPPVEAPAAQPSAAAPVQAAGAVPVQPAAASDDAPANPMAFFKKK